MKIVIGIICIWTVLILGNMLEGCSPSRVHLQFVVPAGYRGFLVTQFSVRDGNDVRTSGNEIVVHFHSNGLAATKLTDKEVFKENTIEDYVCIDTSGKKIACFVDPKSTGIAICGGDEMNGTSAGHQYSIYVLWLGNPATYQSLRNSSRYNVELNDYLERVVGHRLWPE